MHAVLDALEQFLLSLPHCVFGMLSCKKVFRSVFLCLFFTGVKTDSVYL